MGESEVSVRRDGAAAKPKASATWNSLGLSLGDVGFNPCLAFLIRDLEHTAPLRDGQRVYSLLFHILDEVRQRLIPGFRKEENNKTREDGEDSLHDQGQVGRIYS